MGILSCFSRGFKIIFSFSRRQSAKKQTSTLPVPTIQEPTDQDSDDITRCIDNLLKIDSRSLTPASMVARSSRTLSINENMPPRPMKVLQEKLKGSRVKAEDERMFLPRPLLLKHVKEHIEDVLRDDDLFPPTNIPEVVDYIIRNAPQLFAILVYLGKVECIPHFLEEGINDSHLPFIENESSEKPKVLLRRDKQPVNSLRGWDPNLLKHWERKQYYMLARYFKKGGHYELSECEIDPFVPLPNHLFEPPKCGGFGVVKKLGIHPDHHDLGEDSAEVIPIAVKTVAGDFEPELEAYKNLGPSHHPNLIPLWFTYRKKGMCHFVFKWADGNLREYWMSNPMPNATLDLSLWSLDQMAGVAGGLSYFHEFVNPKIDDSLNPRYGRHGDIKANNILRFQGGNDPGSLVIADLGLAGVHSRDSRYLKPQDVILSPTYSPPDARRGPKVCRKWDVWSLGCLMLEHLTWLLRGYEAVNHFSNLRLAESGNDIPEFRHDYFYTPNCNAVRKSVIDWVDDLKTNPRCSPMIRELLDLIITKMIVIEPDKRDTSRAIRHTLNKMLSTAKTDPHYLCPDRPEAAATPRLNCNSSIPIDQAILPKTRVTWPQQPEGINNQEKNRAMKSNMDLPHLFRSVNDQ